MNLSLFRPRASVVDIVLYFTSMMLLLSRQMRPAHAFVAVTTSRTRCRLPRLFANNNSNNRRSHTFTPTPSTLSDDSLLASGYNRPTVQWYPGHIAKAERMLQETCKAVDVIVEVRDARIPAATAHPKVATWCAGKPRLIVLTHVDLVPPAAAKEWQKYYNTVYGTQGRQEKEWALAEQEIDNKEALNQAQQSIAERAKYTGTNVKNDDETIVARNHKTAGAAKSARTAKTVLFVNAKEGSGIHQLNRAILDAGAYVQEKRSRRGLTGRPLRVGVLGYPNVGKSALINKILGRKRAKTANLPGVTRSLQWIRVRGKDNSLKGREFELLDSPGIIPAVLTDQEGAMLLAACNCIGEASYDNQSIAANLCHHIKVETTCPMTHDGSGAAAGVMAPKWRAMCQTRYGMDPWERKIVPPKDNGSDSEKTVEVTETGDDMLYHVAQQTCRGSVEDAARKIMQDFRAGRMGPVCLQRPPHVISMVQSAAMQERLDQDELEKSRRLAEQRERAKVALETVKERGISLPQLHKPQQKDDTTAEGNNASVGKGLFDGW